MPPFWKVVDGAFFAISNSTGIGMALCFSSLNILSLTSVFFPLHRHFSMDGICLSGFPPYSPPGAAAGGGGTWPGASSCLHLKTSFSWDGPAIPVFFSCSRVAMTSGDLEWLHAGTFSGHQCLFLPSVFWKPPVFPL